MKEILTTLAVMALLFVTLSRAVPHPGQSLPDLISAELHNVIHPR